jgi:hypothetical protein
LKLYQTLVSTLKWEGGGLREFMLEASKIKLAPYHAFLSPLFERIKRGNVNELLWQWISGDRSPRIYLNQEGAYRLPVLLSHATAANLYSYILSALGWLAGEMGLKGLLILLDELETTFRLWYQWSIARANMRALVLAAKNREELTRAGGGNIFELFTSGVRKTPFIYRIPSRIYLVMASTPLWSSGYNAFRAMVDEFISLKPLTEGHFRQIFRALAGIYQAAYSETDLGRLDLLFVLVERVTRDVRSFLKASVEAFDLVRHFPQESPVKLLRHE